MYVKDYMFNNVCTANPDITIAEAVKQMVEKKTNSLIVVDKDKKPIGILSSYALIREVVPAYLKDDPMYSQFGREGLFDKYAEKVKNEKVSEFMLKEFHTLSVNDAMIEAASYSVSAEQRTMPVVDEKGILVGAITRTCIKNALYNVIYKENRIEPYNGGCECRKQ